MKDKILFLTDLWFFNFGMAKFLQKKYDADLYAIFDVDDNSKLFFENQKIVSYKKKWYYLDCLKTLPDKPDVKYLKEFEKKYKINLWTIAFYEREFYKYNPFHKFSDLEILSILEAECKFFEKILEEVKPDFVSIYFTISHFQELLRLMCISKEIKILMFSGSKIGKTMMISQKGLIMDEESNQLNQKIEFNEKAIDFDEYVKQFTMYNVLQNYIKKQFQDNFLSRYKPLIKFFLSTRNESFKIRYTYFGRTRINIIKTRMINFFKKNYRKNFLKKNSLILIPDHENYVYFPLHFEPERNLLIDAPLQSNQIEIIKNISKSLPVDFFLYIKEHPTQKVIGWRPVSFYKEILEIPNVKLIHPSVKPQDILQRCSFVATIAGTAGLESLFYKKPVLTFADAFYSNVKNVYRVRNINELPTIIKKILQTKHDPWDNTHLHNFMNTVKNHIFEFDVTKIAADFSYRFGLKGVIMDTTLSSNEVSLFIDEYKQDFEKLADEHIKKILKFKK